MYKLWYDQPAKDWNEALPLGNGRIGAMIYGDPLNEHIQLNEDSIWYGKPIDRVNPDALPNLAKVRDYILTGKIPQAEDLLLKAFSGIPQGMRGYQTLGDAFLTLEQVGEVIDYKRELSLDEALCKVTFHTSDGNSFVRESFISGQDDMLVMNIKTKRPGSIYLDYTMGRDYFFDEIWSENSNSILYKGSLSEGGIKFCTMCKAIAIGGTVSTLGEHLVVEGADEVTLLFTATTTFRFEEIEDSCREILNAGDTYTYKDLRFRHLQDYKALFDTFSIDLEYDKSLDEISTDKRLKNITLDNPDNGLLQTYLQYGRYLLISSSRPGTLPANLQGIWNNHMTAPWGGKYTININAEMNYWMAETGNLSSCHLPLFDLIKTLSKTGEKTARKMYDCKGFVAHHNTDIWGDSAPQDTWIPGSYWVMGGAWLCTHIWEHYLFTKDKEFLGEYYPIIKKAVEFFEEFLIEQDGYLITCPSVSPENTYIMKDGTVGSVCAGASMDNQILEDLFKILIDAAKVLDLDEEYASKVNEMRLKLSPIQIGKHGQIMEWMEDYEEKEPGHRHISQLYAIYPSSQITMEKTPELVEGVKKTLERRLAQGGGHTGWSLVWIINIYARLWDGEKAYDNLIRLMRQSTLPNMFDNHPPFQIDGNFGGAAGMIEMLVQSNAGRVVLLPALPKEWQSGHIKGVCIRGGAEVELEWKESKLIRVSLLAKSELNLQVTYKERSWQVKLSKGQEFKKVKENGDFNEE